MAWAGFFLGGASEHGMFGLEYFLFFGIPNGKTELIDGRSRWVFPFLDRAEAKLTTSTGWKRSAVGSRFPLRE